MSKTLGQRCINVIHMFWFYWALYRVRFAEYTKLIIVTMVFQLCLLREDDSRRR